MGLSTPGIGSGLNIKEMVEAMVKADITPLQVKHDRKLDKISTELSAVGQLKGLISNLQTSLASLSDINQIYGLTSNTSSPDYFDAKVSPQATKGSYQIEVKKLAQAHTLVSSAKTSTTASIGNGTMTINFGSYSGAPVAFTPNTEAKTVSIVIPPGSDSLAAIRDAINKSNSGVQANIVQDNAGYRLSITSAKTGENYAMKISGDISALNYDPVTDVNNTNITPSVAAQNSVVKINGLDLTQGSNTLDTAITGTTITLKKAEIDKITTLNIVDNTSQVTGLVNDFIKKYNETNTLLTNLTFYNDKEKKKGIFQGDPQFRALKLGLNQWATSPDPTATGSVKALADLGIVSNVKNGQLELDKTKFDKALETKYKDIGAFFAKTASTTDGGIQVNKINQNVKAGSYDINLTAYDPGITLTGTIGGIAANSTDGITMSGTDDLGGLSIKVISGTTGARGKIIVKDGMAAKMNQLLETYMKPKDGDLTLRNEKLNKSLVDMDKDQEAISAKTITLQERYKKKFNALDALLAQLQGSSQALTLQLSSLPTINSQR